MHAYKLQRKENYTYADYAVWETGFERFELIDGAAYAMAAPAVLHQELVGSMYIQLSDFLKGKKCKAFVSPIDVCLSGKGDRDKTVVQPDIVIVCDASKIDKKYINGAPDMVIEIIFPSSETMDFVVKFHKYQKAGVREYWIVSPEQRVIYTFILEEGKYICVPYKADADIPAFVLDGCVINLKEYFPEPENSEET